MNNEGCPGCFTTAKGQQEQLSIIRTQAKSYAQETQTTIAIYRDGYELRFCYASFAIDQRYNIIEVVSVNQ